VRGFDAIVQLIRQIWKHAQRAKPLAVERRDALHAPGRCDDREQIERGIHPGRTFDKPGQASELAAPGKATEPLGALGDLGEQLGAECLSRIQPSLKRTIRPPGMQDGEHLDVLGNALADALKVLGQA
jgi:hypothetical protein